VTLPSIELRQGAGLDVAIALLRELATNYRNAVPPGGLPAGIRDAYVLGATGAEGRLRTILSTMDAAAFFDDPRQRDICSMAPGRQLLPMISAEVDTLSERFARLAEELDLTRRLFEGAGTCLVPDTSFYIEHGEKIEDVDFHELAQWSGSIRVLVPMIVVDELDGLKRGATPRTRWRAGYSVAVIDRVIIHPPWPGIFNLRQHMPPRGEVTLQIVFDPPGHQRMPINDDEIVDRCLACQPFTDNQTVITYDTGQSTRARAAGLKVNKLSHDLGQEPGA
jgi:hypothetical protein